MSDSGAERATHTAFTRMGGRTSYTVAGTAPWSLTGTTYLANIAFRRTSIRESLIDTLTLRRG